MARGPLDLWNEWAPQILVLLSLALQVLLLVFAGIRRRQPSAILRILLWQAYQLADSTAIYAVGHLSLSSTTRKHKLVAFWAPFLLLHLGGPDNITAYALEDSKLWLRHLQNLVIQVLGAAYVIYKYVAGGDSYLLLASILVFLVGVVKYVERTWALKWGNLDHIRSSLKEPPAMHHHFQPPDQGLLIEDGDEFYARRAHSLFHVCKHAIVDSWVERNQDNQIVEMLRTLRKKEDYNGMWTLMEMELSLMYDLLYTKAGVIHTWSGYCVRLFSPLAAAASLLLFQFSVKDGHSRVDVAVTYTLLSGAVILESGSLMRALGSTWTYAFLCITQWSWLRYAALCTGRWDRFRRLVKTITGRVGGKRSSRRWSGEMGQYNMLHFVTRQDRAYRPLLGRLAGAAGYKEWWIRYHYSGTIGISDDLKQRLFKYVKALNRNERSLNAQGVIRKNWGEEALKEEVDLYKYFKDKRRLGIEFQECIIIWHLGTDVFLAKSSGVKDYVAAEQVKAIRTLSNYMMFLLVNHSYMLPGLGQSTLYRRTCGNLAKMWNDKIHDQPKQNMYKKLKELFCLHDDLSFAGQARREREEIASTLYDEKPRYSHDVPRLKHAYRVAEKLIQREEHKGSKSTVKLLLAVWIDFLVYASNRCSRESHAKKLSNGGELTTILWLMTNYLHQEGYAAKHDEASIMHTISVQ
ncbi:unnamed protein product [Urochloa decumbens]|uniref:DUF4220 domain-containing protein n=1 Tax=Urochloa decumbens TaxID=240449 RepID=A0ABC9CZQ9_9POAL